MAHLTQRRPENVSGDFYVDSTCIDCDTCRWMAPETFCEAGEQSAVYHQPTTEAERLRAMQALLSCPTASIGTVHKPLDVQQVQRSFPIPITDTVSHCGYHAESSYGAASYLIQRAAGNVLVDSPRFAPPLVKRLEELGGVRYLYLTHRDDVADHQKFQAHFGCDRLLHEDDITRATQDVEIQLSGSDPVQLAPDLLIIPVPGHTKGHTVLLYDDTVLFTGDHLAWSAELDHLYAFRRACWYSWAALLQSMKRLANYSFEWVLPGHGRRYQGDRQTMADQMQKCILWMETQ
ncbi:MBL fold metallo-hydrolase [Leptolyngbya sp. O-77]|uniref:MBL fold metallo-hydrolase n=1 Tax=Leptolyngbya sp. O-77 TaxID=1080068 RepID=UPI00074D393F|nr:MBL fold metallo-hydrolase [Leptolyngbya sp. O-77]BAU43353.1 Hydroxyacylglutathione hydrolase [Leptolyngbya sp. O-77]